MANIGVVIPVYCGRQFVRDTLDSVMRQDYRAGEVTVVVVEDGSPEGQDARDLVQDYPVSYVAFDGNQGVFRARVEGAQRVRGVDYLAFLDQDDVWHTNFLSRTTDVLEHNPQVGFVVTNALVRSEKESHLLYRTRRPSLTIHDLKMANQVLSPSQVLIRMTSYRMLELNPELPYPGADDWIVWLGILARGYLGYYLGQALVDYRDHAGGAHHNVRTMLQSEQYVVDYWFPRLGFSSVDQRRFWGRRQLDAMVEAKNSGDWGRFLKTGLGVFADPGAVWHAMRFRRRHKKLGLV